MRLKNIIILFCIFAICIPLFSCSGADPHKKSVVLKTENFSVSRGELAYFTVHTMQSMLSSYTDSELLSLGYDKEKLPSEQSFDGKVTWLEHFREKAAEYAKEVLLLCEAARREGFSVDEAELDSRLAAFKADSEAKYGVDFKTYIEITYFGYADEEDYLRALRLEFLASSYMEALEKRLYDAIGSERIAKYIEENVPSPSDELTRSIEILVVPAALDASGMISAHPEKSFSELASEQSGVKYYSYDNCRHGELTKDLDDWLFSSEREVGDTGVISASGSSLALHYVGEGITVSELDATIALAKLDYSAYLSALSEEFFVILNKEAFDSLVI